MGPCCCLKSWPRGKSIEQPCLAQCWCKSHPVQHWQDKQQRNSHPVSVLQVKRGKQKTKLHSSLKISTEVEQGKFKYLSVYFPSPAFMTIATTGEYWHHVLSFSGVAGLAWEVPAKAPLLMPVAAAPAAQLGKHSGLPHLSLAVDAASNALTTLLWEGNLKNSKEFQETWAEDQGLT